MYQQKYPPPLIPPRGEVNAADAFDIGSFDEEDTKGKKPTLREAVNSFNMIENDAARLCTAQRRSAVACRAITHSKQ